MLIMLLPLLRRCEISICCLCDAYNANVVNAYIVMMLIRSSVLIIRCDDAYNATTANAIAPSAAYKDAYK